MPSLSLEESRQRADLLAVTSYDITLDLAGDGETFTSSTTIHFTARQSGDTFVDVKPRQLVRASLNGVTIDVDELQDGRLPLAVSSGELELEMVAVMSYRNDGEGMHRAVDPADGRQYTYAMSFLDAAPYIFACFDQPDLKATYSLTVLAPDDWVVVGNGRAEQVEPGRWELATTPPLSTYFVTVVAGPYHVIESEHDGIRLGLECRASLAEHLDRESEEILTITRQSFDELHRLFGIRYPFGDYHQAFVPEFNAGAMENAGCVTFRDPMVFTSQPTRYERTGRATTIAHEMAHQWFGDLVTPVWWDDLWLNESFAEYMGNRVSYDATEFDEAWVDIAFSRKRWGIEADQRPSTHPVAGTGASDAASALQDFDGISYAKGSAILKQLNARIGDEVFFAGVRDHFTRHRFGNATMHDLFESWESAGAGDLSEWISGWLRTAGLDLLHVERNHGDGRLVRTTPPDYPANRQHAMAIAHHDGDSWVTEPIVVEDRFTPINVANHPVVLDPTEATWARLAVDEVTLAALPELLPKMSSPLMRAANWNAVRDATTNGLMSPDAALKLVEVALPHETEDQGVNALGKFAIDYLAAKVHPDPSRVLATVYQAAMQRAETVTPDLHVQLTAMRMAVASSTDHRLLRRWVASSGLPEGIGVDLDLRWRILIRLAVLGSVERAELRKHLDQETTTQAKVSFTRAMSSLPDDEAKTFAWDIFTGSVAATNYEAEAAGLGMWDVSQNALTAPYEVRYFEDVAKTATFRSGWVLADTARVFFPKLAVATATVHAADRALANENLDLSLRRVLVDQTDDLRRALRVRQLHAETT